MGNRKVIIGLMLVLLAGMVGWRIGACYVANSELQSDMQDLAVQNPHRIGLAPLATEQELRDSVVAKAKKYGIELDPEHVAVNVTNTPEMLSVTLEADYEAHVDLLVYSAGLHFTPSGSYSAKVNINRR